MDNQSLLDTANKWLESHERQTVRIQKEEQGDLDEVRLTLDHIAVRQRHPEGDDYTNGEALLLQGNGMVISGAQELPLPQNTFVLPMHGLKDVRSGDSSMTLETERARYTITLLQ